MIATHLELSDGVYVRFEGNRHLFLRLDAQTWLEQVGSYWASLLAWEEHETAYQSGMAMLEAEQAAPPPSRAPDRGDRG